MTQKQTIELLNQGQELTIVREPKSRVGSLYLSVEVKYRIGGKVIPKSLFEAVKAKVKLSLDADKSSPAISVFKLRQI